MQPEPAKVKNILVLRNDRFGEFLLNIPALRAIRERFTSSRIIAVVDPAIKELARLVPFIDEIIGWPSGKHSLSQKLNLIKKLKSLKIDIAIMSNPSKEFNLLTFLSAIPWRVGYNKKWPFLLTHRIDDNKFMGNKHEIEYNLELVRLVGADTKGRSLVLNTRDDIDLTRFSLRTGSNLIAIHPWTSDQVKKWPTENFRRLADKIIGELGFKVVIVGGREEVSRSNQYFGDVKDALRDLTGKTSLTELAAILKVCSLLVSCDSGPVHLAGCLGLPALVLFRNDLVGKTARRWGPVSPGSAVIEKSALNDITVDEVFLKTKEILSKRVNN